MGAPADLALQLFDRLMSHALASGLFEQVNGHEPKSAPASGGLRAAVWADRILPTVSGLSSTSAIFIFNVRVYTNMLSEPQDAIDPAVLSAVTTLVAAYVGGFTLGGNARNIDVRGTSGVALTAQAGYLPQDNKLFRVMTITVPVIVNDVWDEAP